LDKLITYLQKNQTKIKFVLMKNKFYTLVALFATTFAGIVPAMGQYAGTVTDTVIMGPSYSNEIYYSMSAGEQGKASRSTWDVAFRANRMSASILINDGSGVELYSYPTTDTSGWATVDTAGLSGWPKMFNSTTDWETGAFVHNEKGHPDYGWGKYNSVSHNVVGDSLFIIKLCDGSFHKIWIKEKYSSYNIFEFRTAHINGSGDTTISLDCTPYAAKNFVGYSIATNQVVDFEPVVSAQWDLLFTKYMGIVQATPYPVVGVLSNYHTKVTKMDSVAPDYISSEKATDSTRSVIGYDWKSFSNETFTYKITDSVAYFVQDISGQIHKLVFKEFAGGTTGRIVMNTELISLTGVNEVAKSGFNATVYPNPVSDVMNLVLNPGKSKSVMISVLDMSGRTVLNKKFEIQAEDLSTLKIPVSELPSGMYMVRIQAGTNVMARKMIVK
jgi:hypothetical protein